MDKTELPPEVEETLAKVDDEKKSAANDWLAAFAKKSNEALAKRAAKNKTAPPPDERALVEVLARKDHTEYDRMRSELADTLGIRVSTLDDKVEAIRKGLAATSATALPHWGGEPWTEEVDGDALLDALRREFSHYVALPPMPTWHWRYTLCTLTCSCISILPRTLQSPRQRGAAAKRY